MLLLLDVTALTTAPLLLDVTSPLERPQRFDPVIFLVAPAFSAPGMLTQS